MDGLSPRGLVEVLWGGLDIRVAREGVAVGGSG